MVEQFPDYTRPCCTILEHQNFLSVIHYPLANFLYPRFSKIELLCFSKCVLACASPFLEFTLETTLSSFFPLVPQPPPCTSFIICSVGSSFQRYPESVSQKSSVPRLNPNISCLHYPNLHSFLFHQELSEPQPRSDHIRSTHRPV